MQWRLDAGQIEVVDEDVAACLRRMTPGQKLAQIDEANRASRMMMAAGIRLRNPGWTDEQVQREVARRLLHDPI